MNDDIIRMAREAECEETWGADAFRFTEAELERFAALVRADERERIKAANAPEIERINAHIKALEEAVADEREKVMKEIEDAKNNAANR